MTEQEIIKRGNEIKRTLHLTKQMGFFDWQYTDYKIDDILIVTYEYYFCACPDLLELIPLYLQKCNTQYVIAKTNIEVTTRIFFGGGKHDHYNGESLQYCLKVEEEMKNATTM